MYQRLRNQSGYNLIELVVVLIIIGLIASVALKSLRGVNDVSRFEKTRQEMESLGRAITGNQSLLSNGNRSDYGYVGDVGALPPNLNALVINPGGYSTWDGPYVRDEFTAGGAETEFKNDAWGTAYTYGGGNTIISTGGGSTLTYQIANSSADLLYNPVSAVVGDLNGTPPGPIYRDSVRLVLIYPDGAGSMLTATHSPGSDGYVQFDSIPIGLHTMQLIYLPTADTLIRRVGVNPGERFFTELFFPDDLWNGGP